MMFPPPRSASARERKWHCSGSRRRWRSSPPRSSSLSTSSLSRLQSSPPYRPLHTQNPLMQFPFPEQLAGHSLAPQFLPTHPALQLHLSPMQVPWKEQWFGHLGGWGVGHGGGFVGGSCRR